MCHRDLLLRIHHHLDALRQARKLYAPKLAPEFNAIELFSPDELRLSKLLKELLSPTGTHAQGAIFLELFLQRFELENFLPIPNNVDVSTEKTTNLIANTMRRMDVHLNFGLAAITIENKPRAGDQENQCRRYLAQLADSHPRLNCLIYLSSSGKPPPPVSISEDKREDAEKNGRFKTIGYPELIEWLKDCRRECQADRVSTFLNEFIDYIQKQFVGIEMAEMQEVVNIALENSETLQAALELAQAQDDINQRLLAELRGQLDPSLNNQGWTLNWDNVQRTDIYKGFTVYFFPWQQQYSVRFSFEKKNYAGPIYGIVKENVNILPDLLEVRDCLNQIPPRPYESSNKKSKNWPWYREFISHYGDWSKHVEPWLEIQSGAMADMIMEKAQAIYTALEEANLLDQLGGNAAPPQNPPAS